MLFVLRVLLVVGALLNALAVFALGGYDGEHRWVGGLGCGLRLAGAVGALVERHRSARSAR